MMKKLILCLSALLLLQCVAFVRAEGIFEDDAEDTPRNRLLLFAVEEYSEIAKYTIEENVAIFKKVIKEASSSRSRDVQSNLAKLVDYVEAVEKLDDLPKDDKLEKLFEYFEKAINLQDSFDTDDIKDPSEGVKEIHRLLKKYGTEEFVIEFVRRFLNFVQSFKEKLRVYIESTNESDDKKMFDWYAKLNAEKEIEKKFDIFTEFFDLYD